MHTNRLLWWGWFLLLPLSSCQCLEQPPGERWSFPGADIGGEVATDIVERPETGLGVVEPVRCSDALNDRTDLVVDEQGTPWVGYHRYSGPACNRTSLVVTRRTSEGEWIRESLEPHEGIFSVKVTEPTRPVAVYPNPRVGRFRAALREGDDDWSLTNLDLDGERVGPRDGFDLATDGRRLFATFAANGAPRVRLFTYDTASDEPRWRTRDALEVDNPQAALSQGLRADETHLYLVHRNERRGRDVPPFGIARYDRDANRWDERTYFEGENTGARVHSLEVTSAGSLCMSSKLDERLLVTCGTMDDLDGRERTHFDQEIASRYPASTIEGPDGTLYVAFHPPDNSELRLARRRDDGAWRTETIFEHSSYGVSTAIDPTSGRLVVAFYTCEGDGESCALKFLSV